MPSFIVKHLLDISPKGRLDFKFPKIKTIHFQRPYILEGNFMSTVGEETKQTSI